jgi:antitoxin component of MazEF toxin-antitoxin module
MNKKRGSNITVRRVLNFTNTNSLGITIPANFVDRLDLHKGEYVKCEIDEDNPTGFRVEKIDFD